MIRNGNKITFLPDRRQFIGNSKICEVLCNQFNNKALPKQKQYITDHHWTGATTEIYTDETRLYRIEVSPTFFMETSCNSNLVNFLRNQDKIPGAAKEILIQIPQKNSTLLPCFQ